MIEQFNRAVRALNGMVFSDGGGSVNTGSMVTLNFGEKTPVIFWQGHPTRECNGYKWDICLYLQCCAWRLFSDEGIICSDYSDIEKINEGIRSVRNSTVISVNVDDRTFDLDIRLSNHATLQVFCNSGDLGGEFDNYSLFSGADIFTVKPNWILEHSVNPRRIK